MGQGFSKRAVALLISLLVLCGVALLTWFLLFVSSNGAFVERYSTAGMLLLTAVLAGGVALSSGLLTYHYRCEEYGSGNEVIFRTLLMVSTGVLLSSGISAALIATLA